MLDGVPLEQLRELADAMKQATEENAASAVEKRAVVYATHLSEADLEAAVEFAESKAGRAMLAADFYIGRDLAYAFAETDIAIMNRTRELFCKPYGC